MLSQCRIDANTSFSNLHASRHECLATHFCRSVCTLLWQATPITLNASVTPHGLVHHIMDTWRLSLSSEKHAFTLDDPMSIQATSKPVASHINQALLICLHHSGSICSFSHLVMLWHSVQLSKYLLAVPSKAPSKAASAPLQTSVLEVSEWSRQ